MSTGDHALVLTAGERVGGRYLVRAALERAGRFLVHDPIRPRLELELELWPVSAMAWPRERERLLDIARLRHPSLTHLDDFGRQDALGAGFAVAEHSAAPPLEIALADGVLNIDQVLRSVVALAHALVDMALPPVALEPTRVRLHNGRVLLSALDLIGITDVVPTIAPFAQIVKRADLTIGVRAELDDALHKLTVAHTAKPTRIHRTPNPNTRLESVAVCEELGALLRDLKEAGRGAVILLHGEEVSEQLDRLRPQVRADDLPFIELDLDAYGDDNAALAEMVRQLTGFVPTGFLWRHGADLAGFVPELVGDRGQVVDGVRGRTAALALLDEISGAHPVVIRLRGLNSVRPFSLELVRQLEQSSGQESRATSRLLLLEAAEPSAIDELAREFGRREMTLGRVAAVGDRPAKGTVEFDRSPRRPDQLLDSRTAPALGTPAELDDGRVAELLSALDSLLGLRAWTRVFDLIEQSSDVIAKWPWQVARVEAVRALALAGSGATATALEAANGAAQKLDAESPVVARIEVELALGRVNLAARDRTAAESHLSRALELVTTGGDVAASYAPAARVLEGDLELDRGRPERAAAAYSLAHSVAGREANSAAAVAARLGTGRCLLVDGEVAAAEGVLRSLLNQAVCDSSPVASALVRYELSVSALVRRRYAAAVQEVRTALEETGEDDACLRNRLEALHGRVLYESGDTRAAIVALERLLDGPCSSDPSLETLIHAQLAEALALDGNAKRAELMGRAALSAAREFDLAVTEGIALRALAVAAGSKPSVRPSIVEQRFIESLELFDQLSCAHEAHCTLARLRDFLSEHPEVRIASQLVGRLAAAAEPGAAQLVSGDVERDQRNLVLMAETLREDDTIDVILARIAEAADASWVAVVRGDEPSQGTQSQGAQSQGAQSQGAQSQGAQSQGAQVGSPRYDNALADRIVHSHGPVPPDLGSIQTLSQDCFPFRAGTARRYALEGGRLVACQPLGASPALWLLYETYQGRRSPSGVIAALAAPIAGRLAPESALAAAHASLDEHGIVGDSPAIRRLRAAIERLGRSDLAVLIVGESGTGKELLARAIHRASPTRRGSFVPIDCAAIPESLIETELFGHRQGAFTGTTRDRIGLFEEASGGTAFLDQVTNIPKVVQAKLLRVLQEGELRRVGDTSVRQIDARIIAASNRPLEVAVRDGEFREDLYFRLHVVEIEVPPLRDRREDIPLIAAHLLSRLGEPRPLIEPAAMDRLLMYDWPGNVRELDNELRRASAVATSRRIRTVDLSARVRGSRELVLPEAAKLRDAVESLERRLLKEALLATRGHRGKTARMLGLSHQGLLNKIRKYDLLYFPARGGVT